MHADIGKDSQEHLRSHWKSLAKKHHCLNIKKKDARDAPLHIATPSFSKISTILVGTIPLITDKGDGWLLTDPQAGCRWFCPPWQPFWDWEDCRNWGIFFWEGQQVFKIANVPLVLRMLETNPHSQGTVKFFLILFSHCSEVTYDNTSTADFLSLEASWLALLK